MITFYHDRLIDNIGYPNLARHEATPFTPEWRQFDHHWPRTVPLRLLLYLQQNRIDYQVLTLDCEQDPGWYPIGIGWFDHDFDYFGALPASVIQRLGKELRVLFWYHEGDHPGRIQQRLNLLAQRHHIPDHAWLFVSANTLARELESFHYFADHEWFFRYVNRHQSAQRTQEAAHDFTILNRTPKWWRAGCMSSLEAAGILHRSLWSYNPSGMPMLDHEQDCPLELDSQPGWRSSTQRFANTVKQIPGDEVNHNDHHWVNKALYHGSHCHIVLETHFDADQSQGTFLTEKTYKCIKYGQPFVLAAPPGSLAELRSQGYRVFDHCIDNSYDTVTDNTERWQAVLNSIIKLSRQDLAHWNLSCAEDCAHNQKLFESRGRELARYLDFLY